jgi:hypothetical protein
MNADRPNPTIGQRSTVHWTIHQTVVLCPLGHLYLIDLSSGDVLPHGHDCTSLMGIAHWAHADSRRPTGRRAALHSKSLSFG